MKSKVGGLCFLRLRKLDPISKAQKVFFSLSLSFKLFISVREREREKAASSSQPQAKQNPCLCCCCECCCNTHKEKYEEEGGNFSFIIFSLFLNFFYLSGLHLQISRGRRSRRRKNIVYLLKSLSQGMFLKLSIFFLFLLRLN